MLIKLFLCKSNFYINTVRGFLVELKTQFLILEGSFGYKGKPWS